MDQPVLKHEPFLSECWSMSRPLAPRLLAVLGCPAQCKTAGHRFALAGRLKLQSAQADCGRTARRHKRARALRSFGTLGRSVARAVFKSTGAGRVVAIGCAAVRVVTFGRAAGRVDSLERAAPRVPSSSAGAVEALAFGRAAGRVDAGARALVGGRS